MLSLEQCKKLAERGMDIRHDAIEFDSQPLNTLLDADDDTYYRIPSLQEVIEFAEDVAGFAIILRYDSRAKPDWYAAESHEIQTGEADTPEAALYALIEKLEVSYG